MELYFSCLLEVLCRLLPDQTREPAAGLLEFLFCLSLSFLHWNSTQQDQQHFRLAPAACCSHCVCLLAMQAWHNLVNICVLMAVAVLSFSYCLSASCCCFQQRSHLFLASSRARPSTKVVAVQQLLAYLQLHLGAVVVAMHDLRQCAAQRDGCMVLNPRCTSTAGAACFCGGKEVSPAAVVAPDGWQTAQCTQH